MPILIDGNNLLHALPPGGRSREAVRRLIMDQTRGEKISVTVVFDGGPTEGARATEHLGAVTVVYAGKRTADDVIISRIPSGAAAKSWTVVTNDRRLSERARHRGASTRTLAEWRNRPVRGRRSRPSRTESPLSAREIDQWQEFFSDRPAADDEKPVSLPRRKRRDR